MIEKTLVITLGVLVIANFAGALANTINWRRARHYYAVHWSQLSDEDRAVMRWMGRTAWVTLLVAVAML